MRRLRFDLRHGRGAHDHGGAAGEPSWKTEGITLTCTQNGETLGTATFSGGSGPNQSPIAFVGDASFGTPNSIFVQVQFTLTVGENV